MVYQKKTLTGTMDEEMEKSEEKMNTELLAYCLETWRKLEAEAPDTEEKKAMVIPVINT